MTCSRTLLFTFLLLLPLSIGAFAADLTPLIDLPGSKWRQKEPFFTRMEKHTGREPRRLTVHYTSVPKRGTQTLPQKLHILFDYSVKETVVGNPKNKKPPRKKKAWGDIPYHYYLDLEGNVAEARDPEYRPDTNTKYNTDGHITIVVEGDKTDGITAKQKAKLFLLMKALQELHKIPLSRVGVHKDFAQTDCPGKEISDAVSEYKKAGALNVAASK